MNHRRKEGQRKSDSFDAQARDETLQTLGVWEEGVEEADLSQAQGGPCNGEKGKSSVG